MYRATTDRRASELAEQAAIRATLEAYFSSIDRRDWDAYGQCFAVDAQAEFGGETEHVVGREAIVLRAVTRRDRPVSNHLLSNAHIIVTGDRATAVTHCIAHLVVSRGDCKTVVVRGIVYEDELVVDADRVWRIARRVHKPPWQYEAPAMPLGYSASE